MMRQAMNLKPGERLVGISWVSKNKTIGSNKTIDLIQWKEILSTPGIRFVDLQYGDTREERAEFAKPDALDI